MERADSAPYPSSSSIITTATPLIPRWAGPQQTLTTNAVPNAPTVREAVGQTCHPRVQGHRSYENRRSSSVTTISDSNNTCTLYVQTKTHSTNEHQRTRKRDSINSDDKQQLCTFRAFTPHSRRCPRGHFTKNQSHKDPRDSSGLTSNFRTCHTEGLKPPSKKSHQYSHKHTYIFQVL